MAEVIRVGTGGSIVVETELNESKNPPTAKAVKDLFLEGVAEYGLPSVNETDNGKIVKVAEGKWVKADFPEATAEAVGGVKLAEAVAPATDAEDIVTQFNALIASLVASGTLAEYVAPEPPEEA